MEKKQVLDHGYCALVESWGSDERIVEAARMSTGKGFQGWGTVEKPGDEKLLKYLWENKHGTPFEMAGMTVEIQAPIVVFRECYRASLLVSAAHDHAALDRWNVVHVGRYSRMRASANLRNWLAFLTLRSDHVLSGRAAQWEIRQFANAVGDLIAETFPRTWALFAQP